MGTARWPRARCARASTPGPLLCFALVAAAAGSASANERNMYISAVAVCEAPLPVYDATLRKRPLGILNEGTAPIFISCSMPGDYQASADDSILHLKFASFTSQGRVVSCTLITGQRIQGTRYTYTADTNIAANATAVIQFDTIDKGSTNGHYNISCNLPGGIEFSSIWRQEAATNDVL